ncbi:tyrosine-type recombinase/integrase [Daejeonella oryzae]|uniref:tyrosine-type recombinase/integrase n=1 Tax=Daejeonella oryzae TaxID=1122943 RepID=UPI0003FA6426|nr:tyrosine-type recombinase/integrase [Daejeonella oryzae]
MFIAHFTKFLQFEKRYSPHTVTAYQKDLKQFYAFIKLSELDFGDVLHIHVRSWIVELLDQGIEAKTVNRKISTLRSFYKFLHRQNFIQVNPMLLVQAPRVPKRLPVTIEEEKINSMLDTANSEIFSNDFSGIRSRLIIELLYGTGIRSSELINLKEHDIDMYGHQIKVLGKRNKERIIPINSSLLELILQYIESKKSQNFNNNSVFLIVTNEGNIAYPKFIYRIVNSILSYISTNDKKSPHVLRHTFATSLLNHGAELNAIKELLGHASLAATQVYTHNSVERLKLIYKQAHPKG